MKATRPSLLFALSGMAGLSWEMLWRSYSGFALGVSAESVALTVALMMAGMSVGALLGGRVLARTRQAPLRIFAATEAAIGVLGLLMPLGFACVGRLDAAVFRQVPTLAVPSQIAFITVVIGPAAIAMGMTVPLMRPLAVQFETSLASLYAVNALGAVLGIFVQTFALIPMLGLRGAGAVSACFNFAVALLAMRSASTPSMPTTASTPTTAMPTAWVRGASLIAFSTGCACFALEVTWFRSLKAAFQSTTDSFALMLAGFLIPISLASFLATRLRARAAVLPWVLFAGGMLVVFVNPLIDRVDLFTLSASGYWLLLAQRLLVVIALLIAPVLLIGLALPLLLDASDDPARIGRLYGMNTLGCVFGSVSTAWILLPRYGAHWTALFVGVSVAVLGARQATGRIRMLMVALIGGAFMIFYGPSPLRIQAEMVSRELRPLESLQGADATVSVAIDAAGDKQLIIDGFQTSGEAAQGHYMAWMGHLPMMLHPHPKRALVICFGTGQTANAVRREGPDSLDIVELSPEVLAVSPYFASNENVLADPRVHVHRTDGRTWLRRTDAQYDVITLEPMEPHFAGTNDLYSVDFYRAAAEHLGPDGVIAQWLPLHLLLPLEAASVARTFTEVFPNSALWIDPVDSTGILVGRKGTALPIVNIEAARSAIGRDLSVLQVSQDFALVPPMLLPYASLGQIISDDNQLLAYGAERRRLWKLGGNANLHKLNLDVIQRIAREGAR